MRILELGDKIALLMVYRIEKTDELIHKIAVIRLIMGKDLESTDRLPTFMTVMKANREFQITPNMSL